VSDDTIKWLERLYSNSPGYFGITAFAGGRPRKTRWFATSELEAANQLIIKYADKADLYLSVGTHIEPQETRGGESTIISIPGLWADLDIGEEGHKPASLPNPSTEDDALSIVDGLPEPSMLMHSGGGLQAFWLFDEPWVFETPAEKALAKKAIQEWGNLLERKGELKGFHVDKVADLARILRVPGSQNHKTGTPRPVLIRWADKPAHNSEELIPLGIPDSYEVEKHTEPPEDDFPLSWNEILAPHGYTQCSETTWTRPGKKCSEGISLSIPDFASYVITNFSGSDDKLPVGPGTKLTKLRLYAYLNHGGNIDKAKKSLPKRKLKLTPASQITPRPVHWLWDGRIAVGTLALLAGREGIGKSTLAYTLVADITKGKLNGAYENEPHSVIVVATEDSWEFTIVPRLMAANADLEKVFRVEPTDPDEYGISLPRDIEELAQVTKESGTTLILLDPLMSRVDSKLDTHKDSEVRQALEPLVKMANDSGAAVLGLIHVNKSGATDPLSTLMGSRAFSAVARAVLYVIEDPDNREMKVMGQPKNNLGRSDLPDLAYTLHQVTVGMWEDEIITSVALHWEREQAPGRIRNILSAKTSQKSKVELASEWLEKLLDANGKMPSKDIKEAGEREGFPERTLKRALADLGGKSIREGFPAVTYWELPFSDMDSEEEIEANAPWNI
jgi:AAA domain-containing protein